MSEPLREQELSDRGIGASEIAAALGLSPWTTPLELWLKKIGEAPESEDSDAGEWGLTVEPALRRWYERRAKLAIWHPPRSLFHREVTWMRSTPDGIALASSPALTLPEPPAGIPGNFVWDRDEGPPRELWDHGFEGKHTNWRQAHRWGEPGSDDVPLEHILQCQQGMAVTGLASWRVVAAVGGMPPAIYCVDRDDELIEQMVVGGNAFWQHVLDKTPPPIDGSEAWTRYIASRYRFAVDRPVIASADMEIKTARLREVRQQLDGLGEIRALLENQIKAEIADHSGLQTTQGLISWRTSRAARVVDYKSAFYDLAAKTGMAEGARAAFEEQHRIERAAARPFVTPRSWAQGRGK